MGTSDPTISRVGRGAIAALACAAGAIILSLTLGSLLRPGSGPPPLILNLLAVLIVVSTAAALTFSIGGLMLTRLRNLGFTLLFAGSAATALMLVFDR